MLDEMVRLGFWPRDERLPDDPAAEIRRRGELGRELERLHEQNRHPYNEQALIKELRKRRPPSRSASSKRLKSGASASGKNAPRRGGPRRRAPSSTWARACQPAWARSQAKTIGCARLGCRSSTARLDLAGAMGLTVGALRFLCFARKTATVTHYVRFRIPKKTGGERLISAPMPRLKKRRAGCCTRSWKS